MRVRWTDPAETDLLGILEYIARENPTAARRVGQRLLSAVRALAEQPRRGRPGRVEGTRELVIPMLPYIAVYRIIERAQSTVGEVEVLRVVHGARHWPPDAR